MKASLILIGLVDLGVDVMAKPRACGRDLQERIDNAAVQVGTIAIGDLTRFIFAARMLIEALEHVSFYRSAGSSDDDVARWEGLAGQLVAMVRRDAQRAMTVEAEILR